MRLPDLRFTICDLRRTSADASLVSRAARHASRSGVALIVTVIMLSVITFLAVAFLALSGREKGAVKTATDQTTARLAADTALVRAQAELLAGILATRNPANFDLLVSTNFQNWNGYDTSQAIGVPNPTNVNYHLPNGNPVTGNNALQNLANLFYSPSPPVFITNRLAANSMEFRSYLDLNRNGRLDPTGVWGVTNNLNQALVDGSGRFISNYVVGDPQWVGGLERIELPHSGTNKFVHRFAYITVPEGKTLDLNYIHNQALAGAGMDVNGGDFLRNQGVGSWEINLAAFLHDLNTNNIYGWGGLYTYNPLLGFTPAGNAFDDAGALYRYRLNGSPDVFTYNLPTVNQLYGANGDNAFLNDYVDGYTKLPLVHTNGLGLPSAGLLTDTDQPNTRSWPGADQPNHFFTTQDLFDRTKTERTAGAGIKFTDRLRSASTNASTYDQYTFYRLLAQLGTDSAPDDADKLHLNYKNVGGVAATNFIPWTPLDFFTNAADRLLSRYSQDWIDTDVTYYTNFFGTNQAFGLSRIPVLVSNRFVYTSSIHRLLQVAANIADTRTETLWPSVFRPIFTRDNDGLYIVGFEQAPTNATVNAYLTPSPTNAASVANGTGLRVNVYGVPWVVGAKKGLPNFNEVAMHSLFQITRKLQITRPSVNAPKTSWQTNMMYVVGISNAIGVEAWNSYRNDFTNGPVLIRLLDGDVTMVLTNDYGVPLSSAGPLNKSIPLPQVTISTNLWRGYGASATPQLSSFIVPLRTNIAFLPESVYSISARTFNTNLLAPFEASQGFPQLHWGLYASMRLRFVMQLGGINGPIIDYVQLDNMESQRDLSEDIRDPDLATGFDGLWSTNAVSGRSTLPQSIMNQINISMGVYGADSTQWKNFDRRAGNNSQIQSEVAYFQAFFGLGGGLQNTNLVQQVPFTPTKRVLQEFSWQANDPLVHYMANDLLDIARTDDVQKPDLSVRLQFLQNIGSVNRRYSPWGGDPAKQAQGDVNKYDVGIKDPLALNSDSWQFPTNSLPGLGWLGRIHRGTPWQTIYMKASDLNIPESTAPLTNLNVWVNSYPGPATRWGVWSGNPNFYDAYFTRPVTDRLLFDVFTTTFNDNAARGQLPVNQTNLAAWSALFSGVVVLTNSTPTNRLSATRQPTFSPLIVPPAGVYDPSATVQPAVVQLVSGINAERARPYTAGNGSQYVHPGGWFQSAGDILSVPALSMGAPVFVPDNPAAPWPRAGVYYWSNSSPFIDFGVPNGLRGKSDDVPVLSTSQMMYSLNDAALEWLPQQIMSLVRLGDPRFVVYAYGQALRPAENSIVTAAGPFYGLCTNYQIAAEVAARAVVRVEGSANPADRNNPNPKRKYPPRLVVESYNYLPPE